MKNFQNLIIDENSSIQDTLKVIDNGKCKIALVLDTNKKLIGIVSDGDIRRALINNSKLSDSIYNIIHKKFIYAKLGDSKEKIIQLAQRNLIYQIPIINEDSTLVGVEDLNELLSPKQYTNKIVLMVGGLGTRLRPLTNEIPKPMLKVGNKPILETIIENFSKYGFKNFILCTNYKADIIKKYFSNGEHLGVNIEYIYENKRLGTAGALSLLKDKIVDDFFVMNGDLLTTLNFNHLLNYHKLNNAFSTMGVREYDLEIPYGVVKVDDNNITNIIEKPIHKFFVNAGIYVLSKNVLENIPSNKYYDMPSLFEILIQQKKKIVSFPINEYWLDIGEEKAFRKANLEYLNIFGNKHV